MGDNRERDRMVFETTEPMKRAIRLRAAVDGMKPAGVVNAALEAYLGKEIRLVEDRLKDDEGASKPTRRRKEAVS